MTDGMQLRCDRPIAAACGSQDAFHSTGPLPGVRPKNCPHMSTRLFSRRGTSGSVRKRRPMLVSGPTASSVSHRDAARTVLRRNSIAPPTGKFTPVRPSVKRIGLLSLGLPLRDQQWLLCPGIDWHFLTCCHTQRARQPCAPFASPLTVVMPSNSHAGCANRYARQTASSMSVPMSVSKSTFFRHLRNPRH